LHDAPDDDDVDGEIVSDGLRIDVASLVAQD
jgi:hypothetical protein